MCSRYRSFYQRWCRCGIHMRNQNREKPCSIQDTSMVLCNCTDSVNYQNLAMRAIRLFFRSFFKNSINEFPKLFSRITFAADMLFLCKSVYFISFAFYAESLPGKCCFDGCGLTCYPLETPKLTLKSIVPHRRILFQPGDVARHNKGNTSGMARNSRITLMSFPSMRYQEVIFTHSSHCCKFQACCPR